MKNYLKEYLFLNYPDVKEYENYYNFYYSENENRDALTNDWLDNKTSYIYKVGVLCAIDSNKCDFVHVVIGSQRAEYSEAEFKGYFYFKDGDNDDMGKTLERALEVMKNIHPAFD